MAVLDASDGDAIEKVAALLHDIGKPRTRAHSEKTKDWTFYNHESVGADMANRWLRDFKFSNDERNKIVRLVRHHLICYAPDWSDAAVRRFMKRVGSDCIDPLLRLGRADANGKGKPVDDHLALLDELRARIQKEEEKGGIITPHDLEISGQTALGLMKNGPGPAVGALLKELLDRVLEDPSLNKSDELLSLARELAPEFEARFPRRQGGQG